MSDETIPKFRLRPKLAGGPAEITPAQANPPAEESKTEAAPPVSAPSEARPAVLRPKLALKTEVAIQPVAPASQPMPASAPPIEPVAPDSGDPRSFPPPPAKSLSIPSASRPKVILNRREAGNPTGSAGATPPFPLPTTQEKLPAVLDAPPPPLAKPAPPTRETWPAVLDAPPPPGLSPVAVPGGVEEEPAEITAIRKASTFPFPPPTAKFPPLPGLDAPVDSAPPESDPTPEKAVKKLLLVGTLAILLLAVAGGFAYFKFFAKAAGKAAAPSASAPAKAPTPSGPAADQPQAVLKKIQQEQLAPINEVVASEPAPAPAGSAAETTPPGPAPGAAPVQDERPEPTVAPAPVKPAPPQPSLAFKAWVINLKIRGVRGGEAQRVFIDRTSYVPGDVVNPQLGIIFAGYDESRRLLTFQDKTGAMVERRN